MGRPDLAGLQRAVCQRLRYSLSGNIHHHMDQHYQTLYVHVASVLGWDASNESAR
jgi:hypothetical protein